MISFRRYFFGTSPFFFSDNLTDAQDQHPWPHLPTYTLTHIQIAVYSCAMASFFKFLRWTFSPVSFSLFYGQKSTWPARRKGVVEMEKKVRWGKGGGRWKKPLSVTVWHRPFSFRRHSLPVRLFLWSASTKRSFTCSPPREGKFSPSPLQDSVFGDFQFETFIYIYFLSPDF